MDSGYPAQLGRSAGGYGAGNLQESRHRQYSLGLREESTGSSVGSERFDSFPSSPGVNKRGRGRDLAEDAAKNFKVVIRVRPPLPRELYGDKQFQNVVGVDSERRITISENPGDGFDEASPGSYAAHTFTFDWVYDQDCDQRTVYETTAKAVVESSLQGYNATIFAYGQTGTGKTYTMEGFNSAEERGIIPRAIEQIFNHISHSVSPRMRFLVRASYLQIYNEVISDLLKPERSNLLIREDKKKGVYVEGLSEWVVRSPQEIYGLMERGGARRATGSTKMNELSSRSHAVFIIIAEQEFHLLFKNSGGHGEQALRQLESNVRQSFKVGKLNLVDLAGSERVRLTGATGQRLEESKKINQSLSALGNVIAALTDPRGRQHIPYRNSKLTRILEDSLGGNCKTTMMAMISPALEACVESLSTLKFANRAKNIKNEARVNEDLDQKSLLRRYELELKRLREELEERSRTVVDKRRLLELEEQKRRAEEDKMAAMRELEAQSQDLMREKSQKKRLEGRIEELQSQMLGGNGDIQDSQAFRSAVKEHQEKIRREYEQKLSDMERERETIEEEKAQVDRYKQLLLKQRDIMILLTQRLNERDEQIVSLQDELDAYDQHQKELEEKIDEKTTHLIHLQKVMLEHHQSSPVKDPLLAKALGAWGDPSSKGPPLIPGLAPQQLFQDESVQFKRRSDSRGINVSIDNDRVRELIRLVQHAEGDRERMARSLEEAQAEKISMEYLLREKLEKLVQSEIEQRMDSIMAVAQPGVQSHAQQSAVGGNQDAVLRLQREVEQLRAERDSLRRNALLQPGTASSAAVGSSDLAQANQQVQRLRAAAEAADSRAREQQTHIEELERSRQTEQAATSRMKAQEESMRARIATFEKERTAIHTIMEQKVKRLVDEVAKGVLPDAHSGRALSDPAKHQSLAREVQALQRLVNASIAALKNAEMQDAQRSSEGSPAAVGTAAASAHGTHSASMTAGPQRSTSAAPAALRGHATPASGYTTSMNGANRFEQSSMSGSAAVQGYGQGPRPVQGEADGGRGSPSMTEVRRMIEQRKEEMLRERKATAGMSR